MLDYLITYGGPEILVAVVVLLITPLAYFAILRRVAVWVRISAIALLWGGTIHLAYWDVYQIAKEAERLCREEAGLHVYRTVEAEGLLGLSSIEYWAQFGLKYVEFDFGREKFRYTLAGGRVEKTPVNEFRSRYELTHREELVGTKCSAIIERARSWASGSTSASIRVG
jgi:hypothetical protein